MTETGTGKNRIGSLWRWLGRTPVQTFILCPLAVIAFELTLYRRLTIVPWGVPLMAWGYLQYLLVGRYRHPRAGGSAGMEVPPERPPHLPDGARGDALVVVRADRARGSRGLVRSPRTP
jgi:hypothetical protein